MARYTRGQVCGVDNCPSRLWKRVDGRNVCQYGHVNEHDIEIDDEDDMRSGPSVGRDYKKKLTNVAGLTTSQAVKDRTSRLLNERTFTRKYGEDFRNLQMRCFQIILAKNTKFILEKLNLPHDQQKIYISTVMLIWSQILKEGLNRRLESKRKGVTIGYIHVINYLAIIRMNLPMYLGDYINITYEKRYNLERCEYCLPRELRIQIPMSQISGFHGTLSMNIVRMINTRYLHEYIKENMTESKVNYYPLMVRVVLNLYLPLEICTLYKNCVDILDIDFSFKDASETRIHPEVKMMALLIIVMNIFFWKSDPKDYSTWHHRYSKYKDHKDNFTRTNFINLKKKIFYDSDHEGIFNWTQTQVWQFIQFYDKNILPNISSFNVATNNEYKDKNEIQLAKSLKEMFSAKTCPAEERADYESPEESVSRYTSFLAGVYKDSSSVNDFTATTSSEQPSLDPSLRAANTALCEHVAAMLQCNSDQLLTAVRHVWKQLYTSLC